MTIRPGNHKAYVIRMLEAKTRKDFTEIIRTRRAAGKSYRQIGQEFGVSGQTVWRHWRQTAAGGAESLPLENPHEHRGPGAPAPRD